MPPKVAPLTPSVPALFSAARPSRLLVEITNTRTIKEKHYYRKTNHQHRVVGRSENSGGRGQLVMWWAWFVHCTRLKYGNNLSPKIWAPLPPSSDGPSAIMLTCCTFLFVSNTITINNNHVFSSKQGCENWKIDLLQGLIGRIPGMYTIISLGRQLFILGP